MRNSNCIESSDRFFFGSRSESPIQKMSNLSKSEFIHNSFDFDLSSVILLNLVSNSAAKLLPNSSSVLNSGELLYEDLLNNS